MSGELYEVLMDSYENAVNDCDGDNDCKKTRIINLLQTEYGQSFKDFITTFNAFKNQTGTEVDYDILVQRYNNLYRDMNTKRKNLENEIESLDTLIKSQSGITQNYNNIIDERNKEIKTSTGDIQDKNSQIDTVNEDIDNLKKGKGIIYFLGIIPLSNTPLKINNIKVLYQIFSIFFLFLFILIIKVIKDSPNIQAFEIE